MFVSPEKNAVILYDDLNNKDIIHILLIEDDEDDYIILKDLLGQIKNTRFILDWVTNYEQGLIKALDFKHDIYLIDYRLGAKDGISLMQDMIRKGCEKPIILLTGQENRDTDIKAMSAGAYDYLVKGDIKSTELDRSIRYALSRCQAEKELRESQEKYKAVLENIHECVYIKNPPCDNYPYGKIVFISKRVENITGYTDREILNDSDLIKSNLHPDDLEEYKKQMGGRFDPENKSAFVELEFRIQHKTTKDYLWLEDKVVPRFDERGNIISYIGVIRDVTERKITEEQLRHDALHDQLTGLPNRTLFMDRLNNAMDRGQRRSEYQYAVLFIDLDRFKNINDVMGHLAGDQLLVTMSERLQSFVRPGDTVSRLGGDEFAILLEEIAYAYDATFVAERIQDLVSTPLVIDGNEVFTTASIGIALSTTGYSNPQDMLRDADTAMYKAKADGRAKHEVFDTEMHSRAVAILELETDLRKAVERDEFRVVYQPIISLVDGNIIAFEALVRWHHPVNGIISPLEFIPLAEETGLIVAIGKCVLRQACEQMREWKRLYSDQALSMTVNLSARQFAQIDLVEQIDDIISDTEMDASSLKLEITESVVMENAECINAVLSQFKSMNLSLSMDDFGTGYSSLSYLHRLPIDTLKIDRSFIGRIDGDEKQSDIVDTIITLAHSLNLEVIAEGIETVHQLDRLRNLGCELGQGYLFSKPVSANEATLLLRQKNLPITQ